MASLSDADIRKFDQEHQYAKLGSEKLKLLGALTEQQREKEFKQMTVSWMHWLIPINSARLCVKRLGKTIWIDWDNPKSYNWIYVSSRAALLVMAGIGLILALRRRWSLGFPALIYLSTLLLYTLTITAARFAISIRAGDVVFLRVGFGEL